MTNRNRTSKPMIVGLLITGLMGAVAPAIAAEIPKAGREDQRIRFIDYDPYQVTRIVGGIRSSTQIEFASDEEVTQVALGNTIAWRSPRPAMWCS